MKVPKYLKENKMNKRGNIIADIAAFGIILFVILAVMFVVNLFWSETYDNLIQEDADLTSTVEINQTYQNMDSWINSWGFIFFFVVAGAFVFLIIMAQVIEVHPGFYILAIFGLIIFIILAASISNGFSEFVDDDAFTEQKETYSLASNVVLYLPIFILLLGTIVLIVMYTKP